MGSIVHTESRRKQWKPQIKHNWKKRIEKGTIKGLLAKVAKNRLHGYVAVLLETMNSAESSLSFEKL